MTEVSAALRDLETRLSHDPDNLPLRVRVATLLHQVGRTGEAARLLRSVAFAYRDSGRHDEAVAIARSILDIVPADTAIHTLLAELERRDDEVTETIRGVAIHGVPTFVESAVPVARTSARARSASLAALIAQPRISVRPPPLQLAPRLAPRVLSEDTPLPGSLPYHIAEPTTPASKDPFGVLGVRSEPSESPKVAGLAEAARRISGLIADEGNRLAVPGPPGQLSDPPVDVAEHPGDGEADEELTSPRHMVQGTGEMASDPLANLFFASLPEPDRAIALQKFDRQRVAAGTIVMRRGAAAPLIAVIRGQLELRLERANSPDAILDTIEEGFYVGEAALVGRASAPATVVAVVDCDLLTLQSHALFELASAYPALWAALKDSAERRMRRYDSVIRALP